MDAKEQIELYLAGLADETTRRWTENALLSDAAFFEDFVEAVEQHLCAAPQALAGAVMRLIPGRDAAPAPAPVLSGKLCAAVCFCSAAAILLLTISGLDRQIAEFLSAGSGKLAELMAFVQNLTIGGYFL